MSNEMESSELEASKLISVSFDRDLTSTELARLNELLKVSPKSRSIKQALEMVRQVAHSPNSFEENRVTAQRHLPEDARSRIQHAIDQAIGVPEEIVVEVSQQLRNVAFASVLIGSGRVTEGELTSAVADWTAYGSESLSAHLTARGMLSPEETNELESIAEQALRDTSIGADTSAIPPGAPTSDSFVSDPETLSKVANLLGLGHIAANALDDDSRSVVAKYRLVKKIGQGGLGSVWLAHDEKLKRNVALKEIAKSGLGDSTIKRFEREAQVTGQLEHPNIVSVYQYGEDNSTGKLFYTMRFVGKNTLRNAIAEYHQRRSEGLEAKGELAQLLSAFQTVCQAVAFAHSRGVVHRDLKPENVALDSFGQVIVIDWGLAKLFGEQEHFDATVADGPTSLEAAEQTVAGQVLGTPHYMSPEQASGRIDEVDERTDVYGLGAILFTILTGRAPHEAQFGSEHRPLRLDELLTHIVRNPTPSAYDVDENVPIELSCICEKAMAKHKFGRFNSALALAEAIQSWSAGIENRTRQFEEIKSQARELEVRLSGAVQDIIRNARFVAMLPPIQGIIDSTSERDGSERIDIWQERLQTIFDGLIRTNNDMLAVTYLSLSDNVATELVRVERHANDMSFIRSTPASRLVSWTNSDLMESVAQLEPGDTNFGIAAPRRASKRRRQEKRLTTVLPVFDQTNGDLFGVVAIETDMARMIETAVSFSKRPTTCVLVADNNHTIWFDDSGGNDSVSVRQMKVPDFDKQCPELVKLFHGKRDVSDNRSFVARRIMLGDFDDETSLAIMVRSTRESQGH